MIRVVGRWLWRNVVKRIWCFALHLNVDRFWCIIHGQWRCPQCDTLWGED